MNGALCLISDSEKLTWEMPTFQVVVNGGNRKKIDALRLIQFIKDANPDHVYIERVNAMPENGAAAAFTYGFGAGVIETCVVGLHKPFTYVVARVWKKDLNVPKDKNASRLRASQLLPDIAHNWSLKRQDGVAEAAMIALYGFNKENQPKENK